eukprot:CAMPEP_0178928716 /NCGR_PEP_ID=MMETSP0786-20121207/20092_1 /TAXON_ID=186022 /ORGANISM="Thalassionema frauenfeldii, Strain CCMP 1798" /LENGTH=139 /DNA_ID=CAMNT_0020604679 /DNA_START=351 /DNA_END=766 /DNA_ORIENTATION=-
MATTPPSKQFQPSNGKYFLLSQYFFNAEKYMLAEDLKLGNCVLSSLSDLVEQEIEVFSVPVVGSLAELIMQEFPTAVLRNQIFYTSHQVRTVETGKFINVIALVFGPFRDDVENDVFWKYLMEECNKLLPRNIVHFKLV